MKRFLNFRSGMGQHRRRPPLGGQAAVLIRAGAKGVGEFPAERSRAFGPAAASLGDPMPGRGGGEPPTQGEIPRHHCRPAFDGPAGQPD